MYDTETGRKIIYTTTFIAHPDYDPDSIANDVSLVRLPHGKLTSYTEHIKPACLPPRGYQETQLGNSSLYAVGWGKTANGANISPVLNQLEVSLISNEQCRKSYGDIIKTTNLCAQGSDGTGTCQVRDHAPMLNKLFLKLLIYLLSVISNPHRQIVSSVL